MGSNQVTPETVMGELDFFGKVTASVTHQIKNDLAVISETGNLVVEMMALVEQGREFEPGRIGVLAQRVVDRVERSNRIIKKLNTFAHSAEQENDRAEGVRTLELMVGLYERPAGLKNVGLLFEPAPGGEAMEIRVRPLLLERILWAALEAAVGAARPESRVEASLSRTEGGISLWLRGEFSRDPVLPSPELLARGSVEATLEAGALRLEFPS